MLNHMQQNLTLTGVGWWVHDYQSEEWIDATTAWYVVGEQIKSPMNHGMAAFGTQDAPRRWPPRRRHGARLGQAAHRARDGRSPTLGEDEQLSMVYC